MKNRNAYLKWHLLKDKVKGHKDMTKALLNCCGLDLHCPPPKSHLFIAVPLEGSLIRGVLYLLSQAV